MDHEIVKCVGISGGEPYTHPDIDTILQCVLDFGFRLRVITNGSMMNKKRLDLLLQNDCILQISLDGTSIETHEKYRGVGSFEQILQILDYMHAHGFQNGIIRMTITKVNYLQVIDMYRLCMEYGFFPSFSVVQPFGLALLDWMDLSLSSIEYTSVIEQMERLARMDKRMVQQLKNIRPILSCPIEHGNSIILKPIIDSHGNVFPCHSLMSKKYSLGNCFYTGFSTIIAAITESSFFALREDHISHMRRICNSCVLNETGMCNMGCPAIVFATDNETLNHDCHMRIQRVFNRCKKNIIQ